MTEPGASADNPIDNETPWVKEQIDQYLATDGQKPDFRYDSPLLLLTTRGSKSGLWRRTCLIYGEDDGRYLIVASLGGAPKHPSWYVNLQHDPHVRLQVGPEVIDGIARTATPEEKPALWEEMVRIYPDYADYQEKTDRDIPIVVVERA